MTDQAIDELINGQIDGLDAENLVAIDVNGIDEQAEVAANDLVKNLSTFYYDEEFFHKYPNFKKRVDAELENLRILIKMRKVNESAHDALSNAISANNSNASLYRSLTSLQKSEVDIITKIQDVLTSLNNLMKGYQLEINFQKENNQETENFNKETFRGSKNFISEMLKQS